MDCTETTSRVRSTHRAVVNAAKSVQIHGLDFEEDPSQCHIMGLSDALKTAEERLSEYRELIHAERMKGDANA